MSTEEEKKALINRRRVLKASLARICNQINQFNNDTPIEVLYVKNERLLALLSDFNVVQGQIDLTDESSAQEQIRAEFEDKHDEIKAKLQQLINVRSNNCSSDNSEHKEPTNNNTGACSLPKIRLPEFSGEVTQFMHFHDMFESLILKNQSLGDIEKFHYLVSSVRGAAHEIIKNVPITADNFNVAWETNCRRYRNPKIIVNAHIKLLLSLDNIHKESASSLRTLLNQVQSNLKAINTLKLDVPLHEIIISQLLLDKLPDTTRKQWEMSNNSQEFATLGELFEYLERRAQTLELIDFSPHNKVQLDDKGGRSFRGTTSKHNFKHDKQPSHSSSYVTVNDNCKACKEQHAIYRCQTFLGYDAHRRNDLVKQHMLCYNCLRESHSVKACPSNTRCKICSGRHNTLLHFDTKGQVGSSDQSRQGNSSRGSSSNTTQFHNDQGGNNSSSYCTMKLKPQIQVLLATAVVKVKDSIGRTHLARCLLDSASQSNFVSESLVQTLGLRKTRNVTPIEGISQSMSEAKYTVNIEIQSCISNKRYTIAGLVLSKITSDMPSQRIPHEEWDLPRGIQLADPHFFAPARIDILLGADIFFRIIRIGQKTKSGKFPVLQNTDLGWIVSGSYESTSETRSKKSGTFFLRNDVQLHTQVQRFWEVEELHEPVKSREEKDCEEHFSQHVSRDVTGRYTVRLPFKQDPSVLGDSLHTATTRFHYLERRLNRDVQLRREYVKFLTEYEELDHMKLVTPTMVTPLAYYMPHHPVLKSSSSTTRTRVVFDVSCSSRSGKSLNDILMTGPTIQQDLSSIVARFRTHPICFAADIEKMYRQVRVDCRDSNFQRILWRDSAEEPIREFQLQTVTYGTSSAPFLATRCLKQLADDEEQQCPRASPVLRRDFYIDDCISGASSVEEALMLQRELIDLLDSGGFKLRKWCSNNTALLEAVPADCREAQLPLQFDSNATIKTLGLLWHPGSDKLQISCGVTMAQGVMSHVTKRKVLSVVSSIYDPLGLISPIVISFKIFLQQLWQEKIFWDDELPTEILNRWNNLYSQIPLIDKIFVNRFVLSKGYTQVQLHGFADASVKGYGACVFLRSSTDEADITSQLLCSKSRVAPLKQITLPRLELCAAVLLSRLVKKMHQILNIDLHSIHLWTDSKIVLAWLSGSPTRWKTFVAHRVAEIQDNTSVNDWKHLPSADNPADIISRGTDPAYLLNNDLWWGGPEWLRSSEQNWPASNEEAIMQVPEQRKTIINCFVTSHTEELISRFSSYQKLLRVISYCLRFIHNCNRESEERRCGALTVQELQAATITCVRLVQSTEFHAEITDLLNHKLVSKRSKLRNLVPFLDKNQILRVGGRLANSRLDYEVKHQMILPAKNQLTDLIVKGEHERLLHSGNQLTLASIRQHFWIINGKAVVRRILNKCVKCFKFKAAATQQLMGQLPAVRVSQARPFLNTGTDFTGPFYLKTCKARSKNVLGSPAEFHFLHRALPHARSKRSVPHTRRLKVDPLVQYAVQQAGFKRVKRGYKPLKVENLVHHMRPQRDPTDPYFPFQWYLKNTGQNGGKAKLDLNVEAAWAQGVTGKNVTTAIMDDGVDYMHPDLKYNYNARASYDFSSNDPYPYPRYTDDWFNSHGTRCAGEVAAARDNGICGVGVAYDSKVAGIRMLDQPYMTDLIEANSMGHEPNLIDIYSASWGPTDDGKTVDGPRNATMRAIVRGVNEGRNGLGNIYVWASGDGGEDDDCNCDGYAASMWTVSINSAINDGQNAHYDESCSSTLASTFSNGAKDPNTGVATTDLYGKCTTTHSGTSAAAPEAAGVFALALEANPQLSWRDIQHLTVLTSKRNSLFDAKGRFHWTMNGVGLEFNHLFGFGVLDAGAMVALAKQWKTVPARYHCEGGTVIETREVTTSHPVLLKINTNACQGSETQVNYLEHVQAVITLNATRRGDVELFLTSPMGTRSMILSRRVNDDDHRDGFTKWPFMTTHTWGEYPQGTWSLEVTFNSQQPQSGFIKEWTLMLHGTRDPPYSDLPVSDPHSKLAIVKKAHEERDKM